MEKQQASSTAAQTVYKVWRQDYTPSVKVETDAERIKQIKAVARYLIVDEQFQAGTISTKMMLSGAAIVMNRPFSPAHYKTDTKDNKPEMARLAKEARDKYLADANKTLEQQHPGLKVRMHDSKDGKPLDPKTKGIFILITSLESSGRANGAAKKISDARAKLVAKGWTEEQIDELFGE